MSAFHRLQPTMCTGNLKRRRAKLYILVMGLTGVGKSTFIQDLTANAKIPIGKASDLHRGKSFASIVDQ